jgi:hypothetical protein
LPRRPHRAGDADAEGSGSVFARKEASGAIDAAYAAAGAVLLALTP